MPRQLADNEWKRGDKVKLPGETEFREIRNIKQTSLGDCCSQQEWKPIETAPRDGSEIVAVFETGHSVVVYWDSEDGWCQMFQGEQWAVINLTHWMPLPEPPNV